MSHLSGIAILVVDDDPDTRDLVEMIAPSTVHDLMRVVAELAARPLDDDVRTSGVRGSTASIPSRGTG